MSPDLLFERAQILRNNGEVNEAVKLYRQVRENAVRTGDWWVGAECLHMIGVAYYQKKEFSLAEEFLKQARDEFEGLGEVVLVAAVLRDLGSVKISSKKMDEAESFFQDSVRILSKTDFLGHLGISKVKLGKLLCVKGEVKNGIRLIKKGISDVEKSDDRFFEAIAYVNLAEVLIDEDSKKKTLICLEKAERILDDLGDRSTNTSLRSNIKDLKDKLSASTD